MGTTTHKNNAALKRDLSAVGSTKASTRVVTYSAIKSTIPITAKIRFDDFICVLLVAFAYIIQ